MRLIVPLLLMLPASCDAAALIAAYYDASSDQIVADITYRGMRDDHRFVVEWAACAREGDSYGVAGRVVTLQQDDAAGGGFRVRERFSVSMLPCRPARVTLQLGVDSHVTVPVPGWR